MNKSIKGHRMCWSKWSASFANDAPPIVGTSYVRWSGRGGIFKIQHAMQSGKRLLRSTDCVLPCYGTLQIAPYRVVFVRPIFQGINHDSRRSAWERDNIYSRPE